MATNDFLQFATGGGANVESQAAYSADSNRTNGNQPGVASSSFNNKALRQANYVASNVAQMVSDLTGVDTLDDTVTARFLSSLKAAVQALPPVITKYSSGSGNHNVTYYFFIASGNATAAATYTNNGITYTVSGTVSAATRVAMTGNGAPTVSGTLTKASGTGDATLTFYAVRAPQSVEVIMIGGGGGGGGSGTAGTAGNGGAGGNTTFGTTLLVANGGAATTSTGSVAGVGGTASLGTGPFGLNTQGAQGGSNQNSNSATILLVGGQGASTPLGGGGTGGSNSSGGAGVAAIANTGAGGGGGAVISGGSQVGGAGGSAGGFVHAFLTTLLSTYAYAVGAAGTAGTAGTSGYVGGLGGSGVILVKENFQ